MTYSRPRLKKKKKKRKKKRKKNSLILGAIYLESLDLSTTCNMYYIKTQDNNRWKKKVLCYILFYFLFFNK